MPSAEDFLKQPQPPPPTVTASQGPGASPAATRSLTSPGHRTGHPVHGPRPSKRLPHTPHRPPHHGVSLLQHTRAPGRRLSSPVHSPLSFSFCEAAPRCQCCIHCRRCVVVDVSAGEVASLLEVVSSFCSRSLGGEPCSPAHGGIRQTGRHLTYGPRQRAKEKVALSIHSSILSCDASLLQPTIDSLFVSLFTRPPRTPPSAA